jgi:hypothetical protein
MKRTGDSGKPLGRRERTQYVSIVWVDEYEVRKIAGVLQKNDRPAMRVFGDHDLVYGWAVLAGVRIGRAAKFSFVAAVTGLAFLAERTVAAGLGDGSVRLIAPGETASPRTIRPHRGGAAVLAMVTDIDGAGVVTGGDDGRVARTNAGSEVSVLAEFRGAKRMSWPSASLAGCVPRRAVRLLDRTGEMVGASADQPSTVTGLAFNPKGKRLAVSHYGGADGEARSGSHEA